MKNEGGGEKEEREKEKVRDKRDLKQGEQVFVVLFLVCFFI